MKELKLFENSEFGSIRSVLIDDVPYFVGKDVAEALGYSNGSRDINRHVDDEDKNTVVIRDGVGNPNKVIINESGLYSLILSSHLPNAKKFKRWVTTEVLPQIRQTGGYEISGAQSRINEQFTAQISALSEAVAKLTRCLTAEDNKDSMADKIIDKVAESAIILSRPRRRPRCKMDMFTAEQMYVYIDGLARDEIYPVIADRLAEHGIQVSVMGVCRYRQHIQFIRRISGGYEVLRDDRVILKVFPDRLESVLI